MAAPIARPTKGMKNSSPNSMPQNAPLTAPSAAVGASWRVFGFFLSAGQVTTAPSRIWILSALRVELLDCLGPNIVAHHPAHRDHPDRRLEHGLEKGRRAERDLPAARKAQQRDRLAAAEKVAAGSPGPLPHIHRRHDEAFYVLEGELTVRVGTRTVTAPAGSFVLVLMSLLAESGLNRAAALMLSRATAPFRS